MGRENGGNAALYSGKYRPPCVSLKPNVLSRIGLAY